MHIQVPMKATWTIKALRDGQVVQEEVTDNLIVDDGRTNMLSLLFNLTGQAALVSMGVGACSTAASHTDQRLAYEYTHTGNTPSTNRYALTNTNSLTISASDIVSDTFVDTSETPNITYYKKLVVQAVIPSTDPNVNQPFREYGLFTNTACPSTPTGTSGLMFNHLIANADIIKDNVTQILVQVTLRL